MALKFVVHFIATVVAARAYNGRLFVHPNFLEVLAIPKPKRKLTAAQRRAKREQKLMTIFINGKQKRVPRPQLIDGMTEDEYILRNADPIWLHMNGMWEYLPIENPDPLSIAIANRPAQ